MSGHARILALLLIPSGAATLVYQVAWVRLLGLSMGSTSASTATVLAAFFLGMAGGSWLGGRLTRGNTRDLRLYAILEVVIALSAAALLPVLLGLDQVVALAGDLGTSLAFKFIVTVALLLLPTICIGATFPLLAAYLLRRGPAVGSGLSQLYALNTAGAVTGAGLSGFLLIPSIGLHGAIGVGVVLDLLVASGLLLVVRHVRRNNLESVAAEAVAVAETPVAAQTTRREPAKSKAGSGKPAAKRHTPPIPAGPSVPNMALATPAAQPPLTNDVLLRYSALAVLITTGAGSIAAQVGWTKYLALFTGVTVYGFTCVLIAFLLGIALGSWAMRPLIRRIRRPGLWLAAVTAAAGAAVHLSQIGLTQLPDLQRTLDTSLTLAPAAMLAIKAGVAGLILLPPTLLFGALFPLAVGIWSGGSAIGPRVGTAYAANTIASVVGSVLAGFVVIPLLGTDTLLKGVATMLLLLPLALPPLWATARAARLTLATTSAAAAAAGVFLPRLDYVAMVESTQRFAQGLTAEYLFLEEGKAGIISAVTYDGRLAYIQNDSLRESWIDMQNPANRIYVESLLGYMPYLLHPDPRNVFIVGFGGGSTLQALTHSSVERIRVVELEPAVVRAVTAVQKGEVPTLADPRVTLNYNDARNTLVVEQQTYDLILSQPSHPWRAGAGNLFTRDFFEIVRNRLTSNGIFAQWLNLFRMDDTTLRTILRAFYEVFPHGFIFVHQESNDLLMFGSLAEPSFNVARMQTRMLRPGIREFMLNNGVNDPRILLQHFGLSRDEILRATEGAPANSDVRLYSEFGLALLETVPEEHNPYTFLNRYRAFDVSSLLNPATSADDLLMFGIAMLSRRDYERTKLAYLGLMRVAPDVAARLQSQSPVPLN